MNPPCTRCNVHSPETRRNRRDVWVSCGMLQNRSPGFRCRQDSGCSQQDCDMAPSPDYSPYVSPPFVCRPVPYVLCTQRKRGTWRSLYFRTFFYMSTTPQSHLKNKFLSIFPKRENRKYIKKRTRHVHDAMYITGSFICMDIHAMRSRQMLLGYVLTVSSSIRFRSLNRQYRS